MPAIAMHDVDHLGIQLQNEVKPGITSSKLEVHYTINTQLFDVF